MTPRSLAVSTLVLAALAWPRAERAEASLVLAMELPELTASADRIVIGEVTSVSSAWNDAHTTIYTTVEMVVAESWKGNMPADRRVTIVQPGGSVGDIEMKVHGLPGFEVGERG